jgi:hypothetical protein
MSGAPESARAPEGQVVSLEVPAHPGYVLLARLALSAVCRLTPLPDEDVADLKLAVTEAANMLVGGTMEDAAEADDREPTESASGGLLRPVPDPAPEGTLTFQFELGEHELLIDIGSDAEAATPEDERELSQAIIAATVDEVQAGDASIRVVKRLVDRSE